MPTVPISTATIPTATFDELKTLLENAVAERDAADAKIEEIRKAIAVRLQEVQQLNEAVNNIGAAITTSKTTNGLLPIVYDETKQTTNSTASGTIQISYASIWGFFTKYILPAGIMFVILWFLMSVVKSNATTETKVGYVAPAIQVAQYNESQPFIF